MTDQTIALVALPALLAFPTRADRDEALRRQIEIEMLERRIRELEDESDGVRAR